MKICAVIVTYNRKDLLLRCVKKCLSQDANIDILIFDNHSNDGTKEFLKENSIFDNERVNYFYATENFGGSGGFSNGLRMAFEKGYDFIWLMDDDGYPIKEDCVSKSIDLYKDMGLEKVIVNALVLGDDFSKMSFKTGGFDTKESLCLANPGDRMIGSISPFNGTLISKEVVKKIGYPREDFFIKGDETEYTYRAKSKGIALVTAIESEFYHPIMPVSYITICGLKIKSGEESYWKEYYKARNYVYIYKTYFGKFQLLKHIINSLRKCVLFKDDKKRKAYYVLRGLRDGFANRFKNIKIR